VSGRGYQTISFGGRTEKRKRKKNKNFKEKEKEKEEI
jgi:hypothetical protein